MVVSVRWIGIVGLLLFDVYLKLNVLAFGELSPYLWLLGISVTLMLLSAFWFLYGAKRIVIPAYAWILLVFFAFYMFRLGIDFQNWNALKRGVIGTTGGLVLFYFLGVFVHHTLSVVKRTKGQGKGSINFLTMMIVITSSTVFMGLQLLAQLREDLFLIANLEGAYQRPGAFLSISALISFFILLAAYDFPRKRKPHFITFIFVLNAVFCIAIAQALGSNNGTLNIAGILIVGSMLWLVKHSYQAGFIHNKSTTLTRFLSFSFVNGFKALLVLGVIMVAAITSLGINILETRLFGFGVGESSSLSSRMELLSSFGPQFLVSPFFGDLRSHSLTTGEGSYPHSFLISILSHMGVIGFILFVVFLVSVLPRHMRCNSYLLANRDQVAATLLLFLGLFLLANVGNFFTISFIWFLLGFLFPIVVKAHSK